MDKIVNIWTTPDFREPFCTVRVIQLTVRAQFYQKRRWKHLLKLTHSMGWDITMLANAFSLPESCVMVCKKSPWCVIGTLCHPVDYVCRYNLSSKRNMCLSWLIAFIGQDQMSFDWLLRTTGSASPLSLLISVTVRNYRGSWWHPTTECIQICKRFSLCFKSLFG